jgi:hypothetical protein
MATIQMYTKQCYVLLVSVIRIILYLFNVLIIGIPTMHCVLLKILPELMNIQYTVIEEKRSVSYEN